MTKIGLLARADDRGIGYQTYEFFKNYQPAKTLVMMLHDPAWPEYPDRYSGRDVDFVNVSPLDREIDEYNARKLLKRIDTLFAVETLMDWRMVDWARAAGVKTVVQGNPEFTVHRKKPDLPHPDVWCWPTPWLLNELPDGPILPVPVPNYPPVNCGHPDDKVLKVLHVAGHAAAGDRNGTLIFMDSLQYVNRHIEVTIIGQDGWLPAYRCGPNVTVKSNPLGVSDRWDLYKDQHVLVSPRLYGGLSLPVQEALRCGMAVVMPDCSPNETWPGIKIPARRGRLHPAPGGPVPTYLAQPNHIAHIIDQLDRDRDMLKREMAEARHWAEEHTWARLRPAYDRILS